MYFETECKFVRWEYISINMSMQNIWDWKRLNASLSACSSGCKAVGYCFIAIPICFLQGSNNALFYIKTEYANQAKLQVLQGFWYIYFILCVWVFMCMCERVPHVPVKLDEIISPQELELPEVVFYYACAGNQT